jgi:hypothetical protein
VTPRTVSEAEALGEDLRDGREVVTGPLWTDAYAVTWPRSGMPGPYGCGCNASYGQSCPACDGSWLR